MILTLLKGGLGNQMFQFAMAKSLALKYEQKLMLDTTYLNHNSKSDGDFVARQFELAIFPKVTEHKLISSPLKKNKVLSLVQYWYYTRKAKLVLEQSLAFDAKNLEQNPPLMLDGYWQNEKYFLPHEPIIREQFRFPSHSLDTQNLIYLDDIRSSSVAISVHVRRGDYLNSEVQKVHGICSKEYYVKSIHRMLAFYPSAKFYFFSDDLNWINKELTQYVSQYTLVEGNTGVKSWVDLFLMSSCQHHIIANSSFSWWGAWLNPDKNKKVIAPMNWFHDEKLQAQAIGICPENWERI
jgi:hypothetical protein